MIPTVDRERSAAKSLTQQVARIMLTDIDRITQIMHDDELHEIPELNDDATIYAETYASNKANIENLLTILASDDKPVTDYSSPADAFDIGRTFARRGLNVELLFLAYWHGQKTLLGEFLSCLREQKQARPTEILEAVRRYLDISTEYGDHVIREVMHAERAEREATSIGAHAVRNNIVRLILDGVPLDVSRSSTQMNYDLNRYHTAIVLSGETTAADLGSFEDLIVLAGKHVGERSPIIIPSGACALWAWIGSDEHEIMSRLKSTLDNHRVQGHITVGPTRYGVQGFRTSHSACLEMQRVSSDRNTTPSIAWYRDFAVSTLTGQDPQRATDFIHDTLRGLAEDTTRAARLRETLRVYLAEASNAPRTADRLHTHRNTIRQRIESATELLGYDPEQHRLAVELALELKYKLGLGD